MIEQFGIGIDIVNVSDFEKQKFEQKLNFYKKLFLKSEIDYCLKFKNPYIHFAGKFAIKEAVKKSINKKISMLKINTDHLNSKPIVKILENKNQFKFIVSLSHEKNFAIAVVISEQSKLL